MTDTCQERVAGQWRGERSRSCGEPVERDGLCKRHLTLAAERAEKHAAWNAQYERGKDLQAEAERLSAVLGIKVAADGYTGHFIVPGDWLRSLAQDLVSA